ncbi:hypothetical protein W97_02338 [Coniosporium apollinis CBS 100218]|uniref:Uncharacterized protein n=1 Tax=Coniosporium apollinis (strain CBS 100218) TaxID=1168221 RepID=R7YNB9_CONA1|nr:uncharacterized protein W97_02338 [Coniosporium apollinis CBS 100218]EON63111.1 hypothetical protein W97_02338 [Coniosporium apollinis CBS 100218]
MATTSPKAPTNAFEKDIEAVLNDKEIKRLACLFLHTSNPAINWQAAADNFGSASAESFKKSLQITKKKLHDNGVLPDTEGGTTAAAGAAVPATPSKKKTAGKGRKKTEEAADGESPTKKVKESPTKKAMKEEEA